MNKSKTCIGREYKNNYWVKFGTGVFLVINYVFTAKRNISILNCLAQFTCRNYGYLANPWLLNSWNSGFAILSFGIYPFKHCHQYNYTTRSVNRKLSKTYFTSFIFKIYKGKYELNILIPHFWGWYMSNP